MRFGSICSGIEAASVAWHPLGWTAAWLAEVDVAASEVLAERLGATAPQYPLPGSEKAIASRTWGDRVINYGDFTVLPDLVRRGEAEAPELLCGGTPCQAFSVAGRREGLEDARGQLTLSFVDLADAIDEQRRLRGEQPCVIHWENVPGVLSDSGNAFGCFLAALAGDDDALEPGPRPERNRSSAYWTWDKAAGQHRPKWPVSGCIVGPARTVTWRVGDAQYFGLAQRRRRVIVIASAREGFDSASILLEFEGLRRDSAPRREAREVASAAVAPSPNGSHWDEVDGPHPTLNQSFNTGAIGYSNQELFSQRGCGLVSDALHGSSGATDIADRHERKWPAQIASTLDAHFGDKQGLEDQHVNAGCPLFVLSPNPTLYSIMPINSGKDFKARPVSGAQGGDYVLQPAICIHGTQDPDIATDFAHTLGRNSGQENAVCIPILEAGARTGVSTTDVRAGMGIGQNGDPMFTLQASKQHAVCVTGEITHTLRAEGFDASEDGTGRGQPIVAFAQNTRDELRLIGGDGQITGALAASPGMKQTSYIAFDMSVRRLMPIECHRLQGFPDNWCAVPTGKNGKLASDGAQYKQLGNSWAVYHARWVGERVDRWLKANDQHHTPVLEATYDIDLAQWMVLP